MNIVKCSLFDGKAISENNAFRYQLPTHITDSMERGQRMHFGFRSEDISIVGDDDPDVDFSGEILFREPLGDETNYLIDVSGFTFNVKAPPRLKLAEGTNVALKINPDRIHLFDADTEQSIIAKKELAHG